MNEAIRNIIDEVPKRCIFDSHFIINELIKRFSDEYLSFAGNLPTGSPNLTSTVHGQIALEIKNFTKEGLIEKIGESWSENIHKTPSKCTCWKKL